MSGTLAHTHKCVNHLVFHGPGVAKCADTSRERVESAGRDDSDEAPDGPAEGPAHPVGRADPVGPADPDGPADPGAEPAVELTEFLHGGVEAACAAAGVFVRPGDEPAGYRGPTLAGLVLS